MKTLRTESSVRRMGRPKTKHCEAPDCHAATREGKPYCSDHVEEHPYVQDLLDKLANREAEESRVRRSGARAVDTEGITAQEILVYVIVHGARTVHRLSRELNLDVKTIEGYVRALEREKKVHTTSTKRGSMIVQPGPKPKKRRKVADPAPAGDLRQLGQRSNAGAA